MPGHYFYEALFPAGGSKVNRIEHDLEMTSGIVHDLIIDFPAGCLYLVYIRVMRGSMSIFPRNQGAFYAYENYQLRIGDFWILDPREKLLKLEGYNLDDTYSHTIRVALQITHPEVYFAERGIQASLEELVTLQKQFLGVNER